MAIDASVTPTNKPVSLRERKLQQWAKEKEETAEWFPFGRTKLADISPGRRQPETVVSLGSVDRCPSLVSSPTVSLCNKVSISPDQQQCNLNSSKEDTIFGRSLSLPPLDSTSACALFNSSFSSSFDAKAVPFFVDNNSQITISNAAASAAPLKELHARTKPQLISPLTSHMQQQLYQVPLPAYFCGQNNNLYYSPHTSLPVLLSAASPATGSPLPCSGQHYCAAAGCFESVPNVVSSNGSNHYAISLPQVSPSTCALQLQQQQQLPTAGASCHLMPLSYTECWANQLSNWQLMNNNVSSSPYVYNSSAPLTWSPQSVVTPNNTTAYATQGNCLNYSTPSDPKLVHVAGPVELLSDSPFVSSGVAIERPMMSNSIITQPPVNTAPMCNSEILTFSGGISPSQEYRATSLNCSRASLPPNDSCGWSPVCDRLNLSLESNGMADIRHIRSRPVTDARGERYDDYEADEKQQKILQQKLAIEQQIEEKRQLELARAEAENAEMKRTELERRQLEQRAQMEAERELNRWRQLADKEERREQSVLEAWKRATIEAQLARKAKLHRADSASQPDSNSASSSSPGVFSPVARITSSSETASPSSALDERPIRPLAIDPLKIWDELTETVNEIDSSMNSGMSEKIGRGGPLHSSMIRGRSKAARAEKRNRRASSLERVGKRTDVNTGKSNAVTKLNTEDAKKGTSGKPVRIETKSVEVADLHQTPKSKNEVARRTIEAALDNVINQGSPGKVDKQPLTRPDDPVQLPSLQQKLLSWRPSLDNRLLISDENHNQKTSSTTSTSLEPIWGSTLGGGNPLFQPLLTRHKRKTAARSLDNSNTNSPLKALPLVDTNACAERKSSTIEQLLPKINDETILKNLTKDECHNSPPSVIPSTWSVNSLHLGQKQTMEVSNDSDKPTSSPSSGSLGENVTIVAPNRSGEKNQILQQLAALRKELKNKQQAMEDMFKLPSGGR